MKVESNTPADRVARGAYVDLNDPDAHKTTAVNPGGGVPSYEPVSGAPA